MMRLDRVISFRLAKRMSATRDPLSAGQYSNFPWREF